jgi:hypothetical protein
MAKFDPRVAEDMMWSTRHPDLRAQAARAVIRATALVDPARAEEIATMYIRTGEDAGRRDAVLLGLVSGLLARRLPAEAERIAHTLSEPSARGRALFGVAMSWAPSDPHQAHTVAVDDAYYAVRSLIGLTHVRLNGTVRLADMPDL